MLKETAVTSFNQSLYICKPTATNNEFLNDLKDPNLRNLISKCWSRVKILTDTTAKNLNKIKIYFCDFGFESDFNLNELRIYQVPVVARVYPQFSYECILNRKDLISKLADVRLKNDFIDFNYLNEQTNCEFLCQIPLRIDFMQYLDNLIEAPKQRLHLVDIYNKESNQNIIDSLLEKSLNELKNFAFPCIISHIDSINDFYIQKVDPVSEEMLNNLQVEIQSKVLNNKLKKLESLDISLNKLCISFYNQDEQYYRAKIISIYNSERKVKNKLLLSYNIKIDFFFLEKIKTN